ncbi:MAG TPA: PAS domain-containing protein, partial [Gemmatimonadaceae bacterium]|nr:PAS domain-containing protein [Gemmatimonadaceae bacterium]
MISTAARLHPQAAPGAAPALPDAVDANAAERLRRSEERYRLAVRAANDVIWDWDARVNDAEWSEALRAVFGWDPQVARRAPEGTHCWWSERVHPDDQARVLASYEAALAAPTCDHWEAEYRFRRADGGWAHVYDRAVVQRDEAGAVLRVVGAMQDATARTFAAAAMRESEARFRALVEASTSAVWRTDPDAYVHDDLPGWRAVTGMSAEAIQGRGWMEAVHPEDLEPSKTVWRAARESRAPFALEQRLRVADGSHRWFSCRGVPVRDDATGLVREWVGMHEDVHDRRRREEAERCLARATEWLNGSLGSERTLQHIAELAIEEVADGCVVHVARPDGHLEMVAAAGRDARCLAILRDLGERFPTPVDAPVAHPHVIRTGRSMLVTEVDDHILRAMAGSEAHLALLRELDLHSGVCVPIVGAEGTLGAITVLGCGPRRDRCLSERELTAMEEMGRRVGRSVEHARDYRATARARAEAEAASAAKSDFLAVLSHEIRTPLNAIVGYGQLLADAVTGPISEEQHQQLRRIVASAEHLRVLIDEILTLSRMEAGREEVRAEPVDLCLLVEEAMDIVALAAQTKGLRLVRDVPAAGCVVTTDRTKLLQAVVNLAGNAVKFTDRGEVGFLVRLGDGCAEIEVRDTGVGIAPEHQRRIYEPFWQVDQRAAQAAGGTGLGL